MERIKRLLLISLTFIGPFVCIQAQITINVTSVPPTTPPQDDIYIAGNFNNWNPGNAAYILSADSSGIYSITFTPAAGLLEYKFTRGSWDSVEGTATGAYIPNRTFNYNGNPTGINVSIAGWEGSGGSHTAADNVQILDEDFYIPQLNRNRRIWLYLPPDYLTSSKHYPVIYLQDGQNLFDAYYSFAGEWKIDESMNTLFNEGDYGAIVVGIDNGGSNRINEYSPWVNPSYGGGQGEAYAEFIVNTLKPHIDSSFRTLPGREYTGIGGSSLGANISMFAAVEYQDVFSKVCIFSPAFWFSDSIYQHIVSTGIHEEISVYFIAGQNESATVITDMQAVHDTLAYAGLDESNMEFISRLDGAHNEWFWAREYPDAYEWLFGELVLTTKTPVEKKGFLFPNPSNQFLWIRTDEGVVHVTIYSLTGYIMQSEVVNLDSIDVSNLPQGIYVVEIKSPAGTRRLVSRFVKV